MTHRVADKATPLDVSCEFCEAQIGEECKTQFGDSRFHITRKKAFASERGPRTSEDPKCECRGPLHRDGCPDGESAWAARRKRLAADKIVEAAMTVTCTGIPTPETRASLDRLFGGPEHLFTHAATYDGSTVIARLREWTKQRRERATPDDEKRRIEVRAELTAIVVDAAREYIAKSEDTDAIEEDDDARAEAHEAWWKLRAALDALKEGP